MKKNLSLLAAAIFALVLSGNTFAQKAQKVDLTDADVQSYVNNFKKIEKEITKIAGKQASPKQTQNASLADLAEKISINAKVNECLNSNGISGDKAAYKYLALNFGSVYLFAEKELEQLGDMLDQLKAMGQDPTEKLAVYKNQIHPDDYKVIEKNKKLILDKLSKEFAN